MISWRLWQHDEPVNELVSWLILAVDSHLHSTATVVFSYGQVLV